MKRNQQQDGLFQCMVDVSNGRFSGKISWGAGGDSAYEYLLKRWLQTGRERTDLIAMFDMAVAGMINTLLSRSSPSKLLYVHADGDSVMEHLACFVPGLLALDVHTRPDSSGAENRLKVAETLAKTCFEMYKRTPTGLAAEAVEFQHGRDFRPKRWMEWNLLRPEAAESFFILYEVT